MNVMRGRRKVPGEYMWASDPDLWTRKCLSEEEIFKLRPERWAESKQTEKFLNMESSIYKGLEESYCWAGAHASYTHKMLYLKN